ncbi:substrate-binding domain-containing protein [Actinomadura atramentaria]|uniref:substrate-binding domain-containing protein n=1 Tax=Actinomadura atramentaria TaxID=1990 RepID=UPI00037FD05A|nr:substrate-binding domain-containing protein [Actinomadura atramentaria]
MPDSPRWRRRAAALSLLPLVAAAAACGSSGPTTVTVLASSALTEVFGELGAAYGQSHRDVRISARFMPSAEAASDVAGRDAADVLVTADQGSLDSSVQDRLTGHRRAVAGTGLTIAVAPGNPRRIRGLADLSRPGLRVVVGAAVTPVGRYARQVTARAGVSARWAAEEVGSRAVLDRVRSGEADAGLVYVTDLRSAGVAASSVPIPTADNVVATFSAAVAKGDHEDRATTFVNWLTTPPATRLFAKYGFLTGGQPQATTNTTGPP